MLRLAIKGQKPPMKGEVSLHTRIDIPPGKGVIAERLKLDGRFEIKSAQFSELNIQSKVAALSHRGQGDPEVKTAGGVASNFAGKFVLGEGVMTLSNLTFSVPGAAVNLDGTYKLQDQTVDFKGALRLDAELSQTTTGWKSILLKPLDPLFKKDGAGTYLPITITGTGGDPHFGVDVRHVF